MAGPSSCYQVGFGENILVVGSTNVGKSHFLETLLSNPHMWTGPIHKIVYCYGIENATVEHFAKNRPDIILHKGVPDLSEPRQMFDPTQNNVLCFDDLQAELESNKQFTSFLSRASHHCNCTTIVIGHNLFSNLSERKMQTPHYNQLCLFSNRRCSHQIATISRQLSLDPKLVLEAYKKFCSEKHGFLIIDLREETPPEFSLISNVFCDKNQPSYVYF